MPRHSQGSMVELLIIVLGVSACLTLVLSVRTNSTEPISAQRLESESVLASYLEYKPGLYNESFAFLLENHPLLFSKDSYLFNESVRVIRLLNNNNHFIVYANISNNELVIYDQQASVCLAQAQLANYQGVIYGSWTGEAGLKC